MGVEYRHFLVVDDAGWSPRPDTLARVDAVLRRWALADRIEKVVDLADGKALPPAVPREPGRGVVVVYGGVEGPAVAAVAGASQCGAGDEDRYTMHTLVVAGSDYRVQWSPEGIYFEPESPPVAVGGALIRAEDPELAHPCGTLFAQCFRAADLAAPPRVAIHVEPWARARLAWERCLGFWRGAALVDFGKDLPALVDGKHALPARAFVDELGAAFRGPLAEIGEVY